MKFGNLLNLLLSQIISAVSHLMFLQDLKMSRTWKFQWQNNKKLSHNEEQFEFYVNHSTVNLLLICVPPFYFPFYFKSSCLPSNQNDPGKTKDNRVMSCYALHEAFLLSVIVRNIYRMSVQFTLLRRKPEMEWWGRRRRIEWRRGGKDVWVGCEAEKSVMQTWKPSSGKNPKRKKILFFQEMNSTTTNAFFASSLSTLFEFFIRSNLSFCIHDSLHATMLGIFMRKYLRLNFSWKKFKNLFKNY